MTDDSGFATRELTLDVRPIGGFSADPDLILHYTFDEGSGTRVWDAALHGGDHSTTVPAALWAPGAGRFGGAYGSTNLNATLPAFFPANQTDLDFGPRADAFTVSVWVRTTTTTEGYRTVFSKYGNAAEDWRVQYHLWTTDSPTTFQGVNGANWSGGLASTVNNGQ